MKLNKIGIQGGKGSFSEDAAKVFAKNHGIEDYKIVYLISSKAVIGAVEADEVYFGATSKIGLIPFVCEDFT